jgi:DNA-binding XRE family transcriptional regulator
MPIAAPFQQVQPGSAAGRTGADGAGAGQPSALAAAGAGPGATAQPGSPARPDGATPSDGTARPDGTGQGAAGAAGPGTGAIPLGQAGHPATFAEWMASVLRREGLTQEAAARQLGVSVKTVSRWVGGATEPRMRDLRRIQEVFGEVPLP